MHPYPCGRVGCALKKHNGRCSIFGRETNPQRPPSGEANCPLFIRKPTPAGGEAADVSEYVSPSVEAHRAAQAHAAEFERLQAEVRELRAALELKTLDHAVSLSNQADHLLRAERAEAALERALALVEKWRNKAAGDYCQTYNKGMAQGLEIAADELAALLATGSGGAA